MLELVERKDFVINASYVEEDGTTDDVYKVYLEVLGYYLNHSKSENVFEYNFDLNVENVNYALKAVSRLVNLYLYSCDLDDGLISFGLGEIELRKEDLNSTLDDSYHYYFYVQDLLKDKDNKIMNLSKHILSDLDIRLGDYYILFVYVLLKGELKFI